MRLQSAFFAGTLLSLTFVTPAHAQLAGPVPVFDAANFAKGVATQANTAANLIKTTQLVSDDLTHLRNEARNLTSASPALRSRLDSDLAQLGQILDVAHGVSYKDSSYAQTFGRSFIDYQPGVDFGTAYNSWSDNTRNAALATLQAAGYTASGDATMTANMQELASRTDSATGSLSALQVGNNIALQAAEQLAKLRTLQEAQIQSESAYYLNYNKSSAAGVHEATRQDLDSWFSLSQHYASHH